MVDKDAEGYGGLVLGTGRVFSLRQIESSADLSGVQLLGCGEDLNLR